MTLISDLEILAVGLFLAAVLVYLTRTLTPLSWRRKAIGFALLLVTAGASAAMYLRVPPILEEEITYRPIAVEDEGYITSSTCRSCHPQEYATWHGSYHRRMTQVAKPGAVLGDFNEVTLEYHGRTYRLRRQGELFWFQWQEEDGEGGEKTVRRPIVLTTGAHHEQAYWFATGDGRAVEFFPFIYLIPEKRWVPRESVFLQPTVSVGTPLPQLNEVEVWQKDRQWNHSCIHCHTTRGQPRFPLQSSLEAGWDLDVDTRVAEFGIACEACHGPGEEHVAANRDPLRRFQKRLADDGDETITNPVSLSRERSSQVCGICHGISYPRGEELENDLTRGRSFRPGDALSDTRTLCRSDLDPEILARDCPTVSPEQRFWSDGMLRVSGREYMGLIDSPCYERGELTCFSCHVLHPEKDDPRPLSEWAVDQLKPGMRGNAACLQCHAEYETSEALVAHTRHAPESSGSRCYNCHMPFTSYGLLKAIRSHEIHNPSTRSSLETGRPNACNQCHLDKTLAWSAEHLEAWYDIPQPGLDEIERRVPASLIWLLSGDAGQRALMAWSLGWEDALATSGSHWTAPFLAGLLEDPYDAVRLIAGRSLRRQPGFAAFDYDFLAPEEERRAVAERARRLWSSLAVPAGEVKDAHALLQSPTGILPHETLPHETLPHETVPGAVRPPDIFAYLLSQRDDRVVMLAE